MISKTLGALARALLAAAVLGSFACPGAAAQEVLTAEQLTEDFDCLWSQLKDNYAYFDKKETDWGRVREVYRPQVRGVRSRREFVTLLERVLEELYDPHTHLKVNTSSSTRLVPTGLDVWAEWVNGRAVVTQLREGFSAEQSGLRVGMEIVSINGSPVRAAVRGRLGAALKKATGPAMGWALRALLAGTRDRARVVEAKRAGGVKATFRLDLPAHRTVDNQRGGPKVEWRMLGGGLGYVKINDLGSQETVGEFDAALERVRAARGLLIDLRATQSGGNTSVAEPLMGRLIARRAAYQKGAPVRGAAWTREVAPRGDWTYRGPVVVLVGRWTASMGEGIAIGLDGMKRATVVGTRMAGLNGAVFDLQLPHTKIRLNYAAEKLFHLNGTPREEFVPPVLVKLSGRRKDDAVLAEGVRALRKLLGRRAARTARRSKAREKVAGSETPNR